MKRTSNLSRKRILTALIGGLVVAPGLALADTTAENTAVIRSLQPNWNQLLSVSLAPKTQPVVEDGRVVDSAKVVICTSKEVTAGLDNWVSEGAILNPGATSVWPGALLVGDRNLAQGTPTPLILPRGPVTIRVKLPGLDGAAATRTIANPTNVSVENAVSEILNSWLNNQSQDFVPPVRAFSQTQKSYSLSQAAVDLGFGVQWTSGSASASMKTQSSAETTATLMKFTQIYYSVTIEEAGSSGSFFADTYRLAANDISDTAPPTYVSSVDYGRLVIAQMQVDKALSDTEAETAMNYASGAVEVNANAAVAVKNIAENAQFRGIIIGGGARADDSTALFSGDMSKFGDIIKAGFVFSKENPGEPISYTVASLDRQQRLMNATTTYVKSECQEYPNRSVELRSSGWFVSTFKVDWKEPSGPDGALITKVGLEPGNKTSPYQSGRIYIPGDATDISIVGEEYTGLAWDPIRKVLDLKGSDLSEDHSCFELTGTTLSPSYKAC